MPAVVYRVTVIEACRMARAELESLSQEIRRVVDRGVPSLDGMERVKMLRETAETLDSLKIPIPPVLIDFDTVEFLQFSTARKRGPSRRERCDNVSYALRSVGEHAMSVKGMTIQFSVFNNTLENVIMTLETLRFPNMYGVVHD
jgi:hypothetical protein